MKRKIAIRLGVIAVILVIIGTLMILRSDKSTNEEPQQEEARAKQVSTQTIEKQDSVSYTLSTSGTVIPKQYTRVHSLTPGTVEFLVPVGTDVFAGQSLYRLRDANIENNYFNTLQNTEQTRIVTQERTVQSALAVDSARARLDLAKKNLFIVEAQTAQALTTTENSAVVTYASAYSDLHQILNSLSDGVIEELNYLYRNIATTHSRIPTQADAQFSQAVDAFVALPAHAEAATLESDLASLHNALLITKQLTDTTVFLLQNAIAGNGVNFLTVGQLETAKLFAATHQGQINQHTSAVISSLHAIQNIQTTNDLMLLQAQNQVDLAQIEFDNVLIGLENAESSAKLELNIAETQFDNANYNFTNLTLASPFTGTVLSHLVNPGDQVNVGQEILELGDVSVIEIPIEIDGSFIDDVHIGDSVRIEDAYDGFIAEIEPTGSVRSGKVGLTVQSEQSEDMLVAGEIAEVTFTLTHQGIDLMVIPIKTVAIEDAGNTVLLVVDSVSVKRRVILGDIFGTLVSVVEGLEVGDQIILRDGVFISEGDEVEITQHGT